MTGLIGPSLFTQVFAYFIGPGALWRLPGAPFVLASFLLVLAAVIAWRTTDPNRTP